MEKESPKHFSKISPPKAKLALALEEEEEESVPSPEKPKTMSPPKNLSLEQKIQPYDKFVFLWNHKSANSGPIKAILTQMADVGVANENEFAKAVVQIMELCKQLFYSQKERLGAFCKFANTLDVDQRNHIFTVLIPFISSLALQAELMFPDGTVPILSINRQNIIKFSRREVACIMANLFLSAIPAPRKDYDLGEHRFYGLMCDDMTFCQFAINEKLPFIFTYFEAIMKEEPEGVITIFRNCLTYEEREAYNLEKWLSSEKPMLEMELKPKTKIEEQHAALQVDFANQYIGGGIDATCLQEQILFVIYPELFVTCLVCERMAPYEAIVVSGMQQFSAYKGYSESFQFAGKFTDPLATNRDSLGRIPRQVVAIDALLLGHFSGQVSQFNSELTLRELNKALVGFKGDYQCDPYDNRPIATGKWGCGVFHGCTEYKWIIQWLAASEAKRKMLFCSFDAEGLEGFAETLGKMKGAKVGEVTRLLLEVGKEVMSTLSKEKKMMKNGPGHLVHEAIKKRLGLQQPY
eukprot:TRINITY_DN88147_c0_g1_i1.p1 TRINITY_DN88147_c0_g1~~TRINITY_DN88147_c0_g1_i1.p1  ORF type:complete len:553 (+),score=61.51 TRINITY_DN88147_c0_g1_i1:96-1661(+)